MHDLEVAAHAAKRDDEDQIDLEDPEMTALEEGLEDMDENEDELHIDEDEEEIDEDELCEEDLEAAEAEEMDASDTSSSASMGNSPLRASPETLAAMLNGQDSPASTRTGSTNGSVNAPSGPEKRHICDICGKAFPYLSILESHKRCHTGEKPFSCHYCDKKFAQKATLQVHERTHTGERPYKCRYCEKTFAQYGTKTVHEKSAHLGIRNYKCPKCDKCLSSPSALYTHKKTHGEKTFQCEFCTKTFTLKNYLKLHVKQVHEHNERKHVCKFCNKSFAYAGSLQVHVRTHTGERPYSCRFCVKAFASQGNLQSHERTHTGERPYSCGTCGRSFIQKSQLTAHEATHTAPAPTVTSTTSPDGTPVIAVDLKKGPDYVCQYCGKRYAYASSLSVHIRQHTGERPFQCQFCDKTFTNQGNMQVHQRVHTGEKPYQCMGCGKCYAQKIGLNIHQEQCQLYLNRVIRDSNSESPINVETDSDCSESMAGNKNYLVPNIYAQETSPMLQYSQLRNLAGLAPLGVQDLGIQLPPLPGMNLPESPKFVPTTPLAPPTSLGFRSGSFSSESGAFKPVATSDLGSDSLSAFHPMVKKASFSSDSGASSLVQTPTQPMASPLLDPHFLAIKGLLDLGLGNNSGLLQQENLISPQLLTTQLLLQQLQSGDALSALLGGGLGLSGSLPAAPSLPLTSPLLASLFGSSLLQPQLPQLPTSLLPTFASALEPKPSDAMLA